MEKKVLYNVLNQINQNQVPTAAPDSKYIDALAEIGLIEKGWDNKLTTFGKEIFLSLQHELHNWGT